MGAAFPEDLTSQAPQENPDRTEIRIAALDSIEVVIHDISHDLACVSVTSSRSIDHLPLAKLDGEWKIVNVLRVPNPADTGKRAPQPPTLAAGITTSTTVRSVSYQCWSASSRV